jgi:signal transduction histidine kinase
MNEHRAADDVEARVHALEQGLESERAARAEAERSSRLKGELLAALSHEMRNPLNAILGWATILTRRNDLPEQVTQALQAIERNSRLQARMISDLLDYAAICEGKVRLVTETIDPYPVVRMALDGVAAAARSAEVAVEAAFDGESMRIEADPARLQQIIAHLLTNAVKFSNRGEAVRLMAGRSGDVFRLVVSDRGKGIAPQFLPGIFDRFGLQDSAGTHTHGPGGLGLGMTIAKQLTDLHSGKIRAESAGKGLGATFTLEMPLCVAAQRIGNSPKE